jgi:purine-binding chemotaxis protein CheW
MNQSATSNAREHDASGITQNDQNDQYLTFIMQKEEYGVPILSVQEIRGMENVTPIPNAPEYVKGVINLRGTVVPIIDLRQRFGLENLTYDTTTVVIVLKVETQKGEKIMGIVVDAVSDVYSIADEDMREAPDLGEQVDTHYIQGLVNVNETMVIILDIKHLLGQEDVPQMSGEVLEQIKNNPSTDAS